MTKVAEKQQYAVVKANSAEFWKPALDELGSPYFCLKKSTYSEDSRYAFFFESELKRNDVYFEVVDYDCNFVHEDRVMYKFSKIKDYKSRYKESPTVAGSYLVPLSDCEVINITPASQLKARLSTKKDWAKLPENPKLVSSIANFEKAVDESDIKEEPEMELGGQDDHISRMTIRDYYAISKDLPVSNKTWLNKLIITKE